MLSMVSVTRAVRPKTRSAFVGTLRRLANRRTKGRVAAMAPAEARINRVTWSQTWAPKAVAINDTKAPTANQMEVSPAVAASTTPKSTKAPSQKYIGLI